MGKYAATSTYIHVRIPFNFTQILNTKNTIEQNYELLLDQHKEPFKSIVKNPTKPHLTSVSLLTIEASLEDFKDVIKALPQTTEISLPGHPK